MPGPRGQISTPTARSLRVCPLNHGSEGNAAIVYGHHGSVRTCIKVKGTGQWIYDPAWEQPRQPEENP
jgi:hypothetical protein